MSGFISRIRQPVKRERAEHYLLVMLLSFAASVIGTRLFLQVAGYPQLGGGGLHIAHVLWGGLLLFVGALLPLILANREVYTAGALLGGIGVGLFIDEVGKFITQTNDYFYPAAAPIIYAFFLLTVLIYTRVRRPPSRNARAELYRALDTFGEVLDHDLEAHERVELEARLKAVAQQADSPELARLARALLDFLAAEELRLAPDEPRLWRRWRTRAGAAEQRWLRRWRLKTALAAGMGISGLGALTALPHLGAMLAGALGAAGPAPAAALGANGALGANEFTWLLARLALTALAGLPLLTAAVLLALGQDRRGITLGAYGLLFSLTVVHLLVFYLDQFQAVIGALLQFALLLGAIHYRRRYLA